MPRYTIIIDLDLCIGCNTCTLTCKAEHGTQPEVFWCSVLEKEYGKFPKAKRLFLPVLCFHCGEPACEEVCPTGATYKDKNGLVLVDYDKCIGCRACIEACPYHARTYVTKEKHYFTGTPIPHGVDELKGLKKIVQKCNLCTDRLERGEEPACVEICPTGCRYFGDLDHPESDVSQLNKSGKCFQLTPERGTDPSVRYILTQKDPIIVNVK